MKKITLSEATDEQIENAIISNPKQFGFSDIPLDRDDLIESAMNDPFWKKGYRDFGYLIGSFRDYVKHGIDGIKLEVFIDREDEETSGKIHIELHWEAFFNIYDKWLSSDMEIEVEDE